MKRSNSNINIREVFTPVMNYEIERLDEELSKIENSVLISNRRHLFSLIGCVCSFVAVFFLTNRNLVYGLLAAILGFFVGYMIGKKIPGKKLRSVDLDKLTQYQLKLTCYLIYLDKLRKDSVDINDFSALLEKIIDDFRPALFHNGKQFDRQIKELCKILRTTTVHIALLNSLIDLRHDIETGVLPHISGVRILRFYIPVLNLLKINRQDKQTELEVVKRIEALLEEPKIKKILSKITHVDEETIKFALPYAAFASRLIDHNALFCRFLGTIENFMCLKRTENSVNYDIWSKKIFKENLRFRRLSLAPKDIFERKKHLSYSENKLLHLIYSIYQSKFTFFENLNNNEVILDRSASVISIQKRRSLFRNPTVAIARRRSLLYNGQLGDLHEESSEDDQEDSILLPEITNRKSNHFPTRAHSIGKKVGMLECFDFLIALEKQPKPEIIWKKILNCADAQVFYQKNTGNIITLRSHCVLKFSADTIYKTLWDPWIRLKWDSFISKFEILEIKDEFEIVYIAISTPSALAPRDLVQKRIKINDYPEPNMIIMHYVSVEHEQCPVTTEYIRAETLISGYIIKEIEKNLCQVTMITKTNIQGILPVSVFSKLASKSPDKWINGLKKGCEFTERYYS